MTTHADLKRLAEAAIVVHQQNANEFRIASEPRAMFDPRDILALLEERYALARERDSLVNELHQSDEENEAFQEQLRNLSDYNDTKAQNAALLARVERLERIEQAASKFRTAYALHRHAGCPLWPVVKWEVELIAALASPEQEP